MHLPTRQDGVKNRDKVYMYLLIKFISVYWKSGNKKGFYFISHFVFEMEMMIQEQKCCDLERDWHDI